MTANDPRQRTSRSGTAGMWLRYADEATVCPGCASTRIRFLDVLSIPRDVRGRRTLFLSGCDGCGLLFTNPIPASEQLEEYYGDDGPYRAHVVEAGEARRRERKTRPRAREKPQRATDRLLDAVKTYVPIDDPPPGAKVLDFGCGEGKFLDRLQDRGWETYGIEPCTGVAFQRHRRLTVPPQDGDFDFVILHHVLEHLVEPFSVLRQLGGTLRSGGALFISLPSLDSLPRHRLLRYCVDGRKHLISLSERCLVGYLGRCGLVPAGRLDSPELDAALTAGLPLRLRLVATRSSVPVSPPSAPLAPALSALRRYHGVRGIARRVVPVRVRAALIDRARERSRAART